MDALTFWNSFSSAGRTDPDSKWKESDIPAAWRNTPQGAQQKTDFTREESDAVELDRR